MTILSPAALMLVCPTEEVDLLTEEVVLLMEVVVLLMEVVGCPTEEAILHFFLHQPDYCLSAIAP